MNSSSIYFLFLYAALFSELWVLFTGTWYYKRISAVTRPFYFFFYYVVLEEAFGVIMGAGFSIHTLWWMNIYQLSETLFFTWYFNYWIFGKSGWRWYLILWVFFGSYWIYSTFFIHGLFAFNAFGRTIECLIVATYAGVILIRLSRRTDIPLFKNPQFWMASGAMLYFSFSVLVFSIYQTIANNNYVLSLIEPVWDVHSVMNIFSNLLYSIAFMCLNKTFTFPLKK